MPMELAVSLTVFLATFALFLGLHQWTRGSTAVERLRDFQSANWPASMEPGRLRPERSVSKLAARLNALITRQSFADKMSLSLAQANLRFTVPEYVLIRVGSMCVAALVSHVLTQSVVFMVIFGVLGFLAPDWFLEWRKKQRLLAFEKQLPDLLALLVGSLRAGHGLLQAIDTAAREVAPPASEELARVTRDVSVGLSLPQALTHLARRLPSDDLSFVITAIHINYELGGSLATVLDTISHTIRERIRIQGEIRVLTTQQTWTGYLLTLLPFVLGFILFLVNPEYMRGLFDPRVRFLPVAAVIMIALGFLVMRKIIAIDV